METKLLIPEDVCLQVVDVQQSLMAHIHEADRIAEKIVLLIRCARILDVPILANTQYRKGLGNYVDSVAAEVESLDLIDKVEFNGVANTETAAFIDRLPSRISTIALVGVETHICIYQTAMGLLAKGMNVWVVSDAVGSRTPALHQAGLSRLQAVGASVGPAEMLIYELLGKAGTPKFKEVLPHIIAQDKK
jgi:nicotinamidase-related amidase